MFQGCTNGYHALAATTVGWIDIATVTSQLKPITDVINMWALRGWLTGYRASSLSLPARSAYAGKLNSPKLNNFHGRIARKWAPIILSIVLQRI